MGAPTPVRRGPGVAREGAARRGGSSGARGRVGAASFREEAGMTGRGAPAAAWCLVPLECARRCPRCWNALRLGPGWGPRGRLLLPTDREADVGERSGGGDGKGVEELEWADVELDGQKEGSCPP